MTILSFLWRYRVYVGSAAILLATFAVGYGTGHRAGYSKGYTEGWQAAPQPPKQETQIVEREVCHATAIPPTVRIKYVKVPGQCPVPEVDISGGSASTTSGSRTTDTVTVQPAQPSRAVVPPLGPSNRSDPRWRIAGLVGVGGSGLEVGAAVDYRLLGPIGIGAYTRVPTHDPGHASVGGSVSVSW